MATTVTHGDSVRIPLLLTALLAAACSGGDEKDDVAGDPNQTNLVLDGATTDSGGPGVDVNGCGSLSISDACAGAIFEGEALPLDIQVIFDQSGSMATLVNEDKGEMRIDAVSTALSTFVNDPDSSGIGVGLSFFGYQPLGETTCDEEDFSDAAVEFGTLPEHASPIVESVVSVAPTGETPTGAAIRGGCRLAAARQRDYPSHTVVNLIVTDGEPQAPVTSRTESCNPTVADAAEAATECLDSDETIPSYVLGVGPFLDNLGEIAKAGGTDQAYLVSDDSSDMVLEALLAIRHDAQVPCEFAIDRSNTSETLIFAQTSVVYTTAECELVSLEQVKSANACDSTSGGWHFDDPDDPQRITLCAASCDAVSVPRTRLSYAIGCSIEQVF